MKIHIIIHNTLLYTLVRKLFHILIYAIMVHFINFMMANRKYFICMNFYKRSQDQAQKKKDMENKRFIGCYQYRRGTKIKLGCFFESGDDIHRYFVYGLIPVAPFSTPSQLEGLSILALDKRSIKLVSKSAEKKEIFCTRYQSHYRQVRFCSSGHH